MSPDGLLEWQCWNDELRFLRTVANHGLGGGFPCAIALQLTG